MEAGSFRGLKFIVRNLDWTVKAKGRMLKREMTQSDGILDRSSSLHSRIWSGAQERGTG